MSTHKHFDKICCVVLAFTLILTVLFMNAESFGVQKASKVMEYEQKLFDTSRVHTINIVMDNWDEFTENCTSEEYYDCTVVIDDETYKNVAIRGKGNTSLSMVNNDRYSYKIEFDHYDNTNTYYGLDKLCLNNIIQDNTYMKDYLTYQMMNEMGVASPLSSYVYVTVNGEDWGLYLAVESVEDSFLQRNYGSNFGELYKPDSMNMGGGRGNGEDFDINKFFGEDTETDVTDNTQNTEKTTSQNINNEQIVPDLSNGETNGMGTKGQMPNRNTQGGMTPPEFSNDENSDVQAQQGGTVPEMGDMTSGENMQRGDKGGITNGSDDVLLKYIDDEFDSYSNIFDSEKTDITDNDKTRLIESLKNLSNNEDLENTVDIEKVIRYFVVHNFVLNFDSYTGSMIHNYYLYEKDGQMQMIPWDYNLAFGGFMSSSGATSLVNYPIDSPVSGGNTEDRPMIAWIFENEEYTELYHEYFTEFIEEYYHNGRLEKIIDTVSSMISPYVEKDPTKFCSFEEFETGVSTLKQFCLLRMESIDGQLNGTIGSTSDSQKTDTLIDADDLQISDMGSMGNTMGGGMTRPDNNMQMPQNGMFNDDNTTNDDSENMNFPDFSGGNIPQMPNGNVQGGMAMDFVNTEESNTDSNNFNGQKQRPNRNNQSDNKVQLTPQNQSSNSVSSLIWLLICIVILASGLCFALLYKRRK